MTKVLWKMMAKVWALPSNDKAAKVIKNPPGLLE